MTPFLLATAPALVALVLWSIVDLEKFVLFAVLSMMILPGSILQAGHTNIAAVDLLLVVAVAAWLVTNSVGRAPDPWVKRNPLIIPALLFVGVSAASLAWSGKPRDTLLFTSQLVEIAIVFPLVFASLPRSVAAIRKALMLLIALTCVMALAAVAVYATHPSAHSEGTYLPGLNKNALGSFVAAGLVLAHTLSISSERTRTRALLVIAIIIEAAGLAVSVSRGAMIGAGVAVVAVSFLLGRRRLLAVAMAAAIAVVFLVIIGPQTAEKTATAGAYDSSVVRQYAWAGAVKKIEQRPVLGTGGGSYLDSLPQLHGYVTNDPNNLFLLTWAELGLMGMAALAYLLFRFAQLLVRVRRLPGEAAVTAVATGGVSISLFVHFQVDVSWARGATSLAFAMMGLMMALTRLSAASASSHSQIVGSPAAREAAPLPMEVA